MEIVEEAQIVVGSRLNAFFRQNKPDNTPIQQNSKVLVRDSEYLRKISQQVRSYKPDPKLIESMTQYSTALQQEDPSSLLGNCLSEITVLFRTIDELQLKMDAFLTKTFFEPLKTFVNKELLPAQQAKKNYEYAQNEYDVKLNTVVEMKKKGTINPRTIQRAEAELLALKQTTEQTEQEARYKLQDGVAKNIYETTEGLCNLFEGYHTFFSSSLGHLDHSLEKFQNFRNRANEHRQEQASRASKRPAFNVLKPPQQKPPAFSAPLDQVYRLDVVYTSIGPLPAFLQSLVATVYDDHLQLEGLFRISSSRDMLKACKIAIDQGNKLDLSNEEGHVAAGLIFQWLRDLPEPLCGPLPDNLEKTVPALSKFVKDLPSNNQIILQHILHLLVNVAANSEANKMGYSNLAIILGPNLFTATTLDVVFFERVNKIAEELMQNYQEIFNTSPQTKIHEIVEPPVDAVPVQTVPAVPTASPEPTNRTLVGFFQGATNTLANKRLFDLRKPSSPVNSAQNQEMLFDEPSPPPPFGPSSEPSEKEVNPPPTPSSSSSSPVVPGGSTHQNVSSPVVSQPTLFNRAPAGAPWQNDTVIKNCSLCSQLFNLVNRKHHCRNCGRVVCANCSSQRADLPKWNLRGVRICTKCAKSISDEKTQTLLE
eukprot:TRINITY_DN2336_c0_g1_i1.p1 TRINITY_DN2336_c0_g1~~TRINITY_DN2336_c0_g1_i1.p1  ORF type:complete len:651 (+),score=162.86 TRINITY_DN2336_c0_g1_i1:67-2019(+)